MSSTGPKKAACAVAASMLTAIDHMRKDGTAYQDLGPDQFDRRSTDAKAKKLVAQFAKLGFDVELQPHKPATPDPAATAQPCFCTSAFSHWDSIASNSPRMATMSSCC